MLRPTAICTSLALAAAASAQALVNVPFDGGDAQGWTLQNAEIIVSSGGNPNEYLNLPLLDTFGVTLAYRTPGGPLTGDLRRYGNGIDISLDWRTFTYSTIFGDPLDASNLPVVLELVDLGDPSDFTDDASVFTLNTTGMPNPADGWQRIAYTIPFPVAGGPGTGLPTGWFGAGAEDPVTFEPILPAGRTYSNVLASIDEVRITTFQPGFFYGFRLFDIGIDNINATVIPAPGSAALLITAGLLAARRRRC